MFYNFIYICIYIYIYDENMEIDNNNISYLFLPDAVINDSDDNNLWKTGFILSHNSNL